MNVGWKLFAFRSEHVKLDIPSRTSRTSSLNCLSYASPYSRGMSWDRLLRLGHLGLNAADVARLNQIRRSQAARVIQREVQRWLRLRRHQRAVVEAQRRAALIQLRLR